MSKLTEKILKEIKELKEREPLEAAANYSYRAGYKRALSAVEGIIHFCAEDTTEWIPVEESLPELGEVVWATVKHSEWISDYDADWLPKEEMIYHPKSYGVYKAEYVGGGNWRYTDGYNEWIYCDVAEKEKRNLANVYDTVIAWMPLPDPYKKEM